MSEQNYVGIKPKHCSECGRDYTPIIHSDECPHDKVAIGEQDELVQEIIRDTEKALRKDDDLLLRVGRGHWEEIVPLVLAKLKAMGYVKEDDLRARLNAEIRLEYGTKVFKKGKALGKRERIDEGYVKWDREKVAKGIYKIDEPYGEEWDRIEYTPFKEMYLRKADQLKEILIGGEK